jgi:hypothetical protein
MLLDYYVEKSVLVVDIEEKGILGLPFKKLKDVKFLKNFILCKKRVIF